MSKNLEHFNIKTSFPMLKICCKVLYAIYTFDGVISYPKHLIQNIESPRFQHFTRCSKIPTNRKSTRDNFYSHFNSSNEKSFLKKIDEKSKFKPYFAMFQRNLALVSDQQLLHCVLHLLSPNLFEVLFLDLC